MENFWIESLIRSERCIKINRYGSGDSRIAILIDTVILRFVV